MVKKEMVFIVAAFASIYIVLSASVVVPASPPWPLSFQRLFSSGQERILLFYLGSVVTTAPSASCELFEGGWEPLLCNQAQGARWTYIYIYIFFSISFSCIR